MSSLKNDQSQGEIIKSINIPNKMGKKIKYTTISMEYDEHASKSISSI